MGLLNISRGLHALANGCACFSDSVAAEFFVIDSGNFDVDVNAVEQGTGDVFLVFGHYDASPDRFDCACDTGIDSLYRAQNDLHIRAG